MDPVFFAMCRGFMWADKDYTLDKILFMRVET